MNRFGGRGFLSTLPSRTADPTIAADMSSNGDMVRLLRQIMLDRITVSGGLLSAGDSPSTRVAATNGVVFALHRAGETVAALDLVSGRMTLAIGSEDAAIILATGWGRPVNARQVATSSSSMVRVETVVPSSADDVLVLSQLLEAAVAPLAG